MTPVICVMLYIDDVYKNNLSFTIVSCVVSRFFTLGGVDPDQSQDQSRK